MDDDGNDRSGVILMLLPLVFGWDSGVAATNHIVDALVITVTVASLAPVARLGAVAERADGDRSVICAAGGLSRLGRYRLSALCGVALIALSIPRGAIEGSPERGCCTMPRGSRANSASVRRYWAWSCWAPRCRTQSCCGKGCAAIRPRIQSLTSISIPRSGLACSFDTNAPFSQLNRMQLAHSCSENRKSRNEPHRNPESGLNRHVLMRRFKG